jgi:hypothetical protein
MVTDSPGAALIKNSEFYEPLNEICKVNIIKADHLAGWSSYARLTESYNIALSEAIIDDLFIFITADCFFSREVFKTIKEKAKTFRVILSPALRVAEETFFSDVVVSKAYDVDARGALALAMRNEHPLTEAFCLNNSRDIIHPLPAQTMYRLKDGYVGRWNVMHPIAVRIANPNQRILQTIDWNYALYHIRSWADVAVMDNIEDGLTVSLTPMNYSQGEHYRKGASRYAQLRNLKTWVNIPWALDFHMAQISHPVRLLTSDLETAQIADAEQKVSALVNKFSGYVNSRKYAPRQDFDRLTATDLFRPAVDSHQFTRQWPRYARTALHRIKPKISSRLRRLF